MKAFIIHLPKSAVSVHEATLTVESLKEHTDFEVELFEGVDKYNVWQKFIDSDFYFEDTTRWGCGFEDTELAVFFSHYSLWQKCIELKESIVVLEHDARFHNSVDLDLLNSYRGDVINLGYPNWGTREWDKDGDPRLETRVYCDEPHNYYKPDKSECKCDVNFLYGAHAYLVTPKGAKKLIKDAANGILPADTYIAADRVKIADYLPHPSTQDMNNTMVQRISLHEGQVVTNWDY